MCFVIARSINIEQSPLPDRLPAGVIILAQHAVAGTGGTHSTFTPGLTHAGPLSTRFGYNDWNVGIDNINFDQVAVVPEPETYAMLLTGLGLVGFMARRRKQNA